MANLVKIWWTTKLLTRNLMDSSYILFSGTPNPSSFCIHTLLYRVIAILLQNYNPVATKTDIGRRKDEEGRLNCRWNTFGRKSHRQQTLCCFCVGLMFALNSTFFHTSGKVAEKVLWLHASTWRIILKWFSQLTQVVQSSNSSSSVSEFRRLC